ncbi:MAG: hypothetical protein CM1200mP20_08950 [Pseudomonadota bacterium]|nr:MAG: hypothetical protein CM1200mP20_08950 [Pseudomonadota bacterium]
MATRHDLAGVQSHLPQSVIDLGGFVRDPGAMVWGHPRNGDDAVILQTALDNFVVDPGLHIMLTVTDAGSLLLGRRQDLGG